MSDRLSKSGIEYLDYHWGIYSGCYNWRNGICQVGKKCWAMKLAQRFRFPRGFEPTYYPEAILSPMKLKRPSRIGVAFMGDLFGEWMRGDIWDSEFGSWDGREVIDNIFLTIKQCPQHRFLLLTKCPYNLKNWSPFPDNCWVGVTATNRLEYIRAIGAYGLGNVKAKVKYISFEPLLEDIQPSVSWLKTFDWVIIGQETPPSKKTEPKIDWITSIVKAADEAGIKVFLKNNLEPLIFRDAVSGQYALDNGLLNWEGRLRQGLPKD